MGQEMWDIVKEKFGTDAAFGLAIGWVPQRISKMKHGKYIPTISEAVCISRALGVSLDRVASFFQSKSCQKDDKTRRELLLVEG